MFFKLRTNDHLTQAAKTRSIKKNNPNIPGKFIKNTREKKQINNKLT